MSPSFSMENPPGDVFEVIDSVVERDHIKERVRFAYNGHDMYRIGYSEQVDLSQLEPVLRRELDRLEWQFVTTNSRHELKNGEIVPSFGIAPVVTIPVAVAYHATRMCVMPNILREGLLPSNRERRATTFPDTEGVIHACVKLHHTGDDNDSAEWWKEELSKTNRFNHPDWGILQIDLSGLLDVRVYQDMHSQSGIVIDRIERVPPSLLRPL
jgi:hypothetical protein